MLLHRDRRLAIVEGDLEIDVSNMPILSNETVVATTGMHAVGLTSYMTEFPLPDTKICRNTSLKEEDWEDKREMIAALYAKMTLSKLMARMSTQHGFHAGKQMYLRRIKKWGVMKNFKASEKEAAVFKDCVDSDEHMLNGCRSIPPHRIQRYLKTKASLVSKIAAESVPKNERRPCVNGCILVSKSAASSAVYDQTSPVRSFGHDILVLDAPSQGLEKFLAHVKDFNEVANREQQQKMSKHSNSLIIERPEVRQAITDFVTYVDYGVHQHLCEQYNAFNAACSKVAILLEQPCWEIMNAFFYAFHSMWQLHPSYGVSIIRFIRDMALLSTRWESNSQIAQILNLLLEIDKQDHTFHLASKVMLAGLKHMAQGRINHVRMATTSDGEILRWIILRSSRKLHSLPEG